MHFRSWYLVLTSGSNQWHIFHLEKITCLRGDVGTITHYCVKEDNMAKRIT